ncbi:MAG: hypothetical protein H7328_11025 [Bdellovibrio sp.]|nr:hypothetical protein [Bdellovibrio sp.]
MKTVILLAAMGMINFSLPTWAVETDKPHDMSKMSMNPTKEDREKMADAHMQMATCLRSDQEFMQCHDALHKECKSMMGGFCPGMEMGKSMHKGMKQKK